MLVAYQGNDGHIYTTSISLESLLEALDSVRCEYSFFTLDDFDVIRSIEGHPYNLAQLMFYGCETVEEIKFFQNAMQQISDWSAVICVGSPSKKAVFNVGENRTSTKIIFDVSKRNIDFYFRHFFCGVIIDTIRDFRMPFVLEKHVKNGIFTLNVWHTGKEEYMCKDIQAETFPEIVDKLKDFKYTVEHMSDEKQKE